MQILVGDRSLNGLNEVEMRFGVGELLHLFDLQASVIVGDDLCDVDRFAGCLQFVFGLYPAGYLWVGTAIKWVQRPISRILEYGRERPPSLRRQ